MSWNFRRRNSIFFLSNDPENIEIIQSKIDPADFYFQTSDHMVLVVEETGDLYYPPSLLVKAVSPSYSYKYDFSSVPILTSELDLLKVDRHAYSRYSELLRDFFSRQIKRYLKSKDNIMQTAGVDKLLKYAYFDSLENEYKDYLLHPKTILRDEYIRIIDNKTLLDKISDKTSINQRVKELIEKQHQRIELYSSFKIDQPDKFEKLSVLFSKKAFSLKLFYFNFYIDSNDLNQLFEQLTSLDSLDYRLWEYILNVYGRTRLFISPFEDQNYPA